jgi:uncharacterized membrane protein
MALVSAWLLYLQGFVIGAFCQFCLLSAATSIILFGLYLASRLSRRRNFESADGHFTKSVSSDRRMKEH